MTSHPGSTVEIAAGFPDPVLDSQAAFRAILDAMAHPGRIATVGMQLSPPAPLAPASLACVLSLCDHETPLWLDEAAVGLAASVRFHCGAPVVDTPDRAAFALCCGTLPVLAGFAQGTAEYPEHSTTVICQVSALGEGVPMTLRGPGIDGSQRLSVAGLPDDFFPQWAANGALFPQGVDVILTQGQRLVALPRSVKIEPES